MGEVFLARGPGLKRPVVIKRVLGTLLRNEDMLRAFLDETRIAARLRHPNIARIDELGEVEGEWFVRMEYVEGASLSDVLRRASDQGQYLPVEVVLSIGSAVASALDYAHHARDGEGRELLIVHRDVTPQNILLSRSGQVKLIDFGVARAEQRFLRTSPGLVKGKLPYMSPEQASGKRLDGRSDLFGLGTCLWEALTGRRLFRGATEVETMHRLFACQISPPSLFRAAIPPEVDAILLKVLTKNPNLRFKRASELAEALDTVLEQYGLPSGSRAIATQVRRLVPEAGQNEALAPDEEVTSALDSEPATDGGQGEDISDGPPKWAAESEVEEVDSGEGESPRASRIPADPQSLVGRAAELADLHQLIGGGERLITLVGPSGVGKSRLARETARQQATNFDGRVWLADLTSVKTMEGLCLAVADAMAVALPAHVGPVEAVATLLTSRRRGLLVLDNAETMTTAVGAAVVDWMTVAKEIHFLVCSRVSLSVDTAHLYELAPLPVEADSEEGESDAALLFLERARTFNPQFPTGRAAQDLVRDLVRRLDGMPLAIELAASHMTATPLQSLRELAPVTSGGVGFAPIDQAFEATWTQLTAEERVALAQCTVFISGFSAAAALEVIRLEGHPGETHREAVLQALHRLRHKSLLRITYQANGEQARYGMYESIRVRVVGRLAGQEARARQRHGRFYLHLGESLGPAAEKGATALDLLATERDNMVQAWEWWLEQPRGGARQALRVLLGLDALFVVRGPYGAHLSMLDSLIEKLDDPLERAPALEARARVLLSRGRLVEALADLEQLLEVSLDPEAEGRALAYLGSVRKQQGALGEAQTLYERSLKLLRPLKETRMQGRVYANLAAIAQEEGRLDDAQELASEALRLHRLSEDRRFEGVTLTNLAVLHQTHGDFNAAEESCTRAIAVHREVGNRRSEGIAITNLADLERDRGAGGRAAALYRRAVKVHQEVGNRRFEGICLLNLGLLSMEENKLERAEGQLSEAEGLLRSIGDRRHAGLTLGARGAVRARGGGAAAEDFAAARELLGEKDIAFSAAVEVYAAQLELAAAEAAESNGNHAEAEKQEAQAARRLAQANEVGAHGSLAERFEHVRMALRISKAWA